MEAFSFELRGRRASRLVGLVRRTLRMGDRWSSAYEREAATPGAADRVV
jgi:hypothetical protein